MTKRFCASRKGDYLSFCLTFLWLSSDFLTFRSLFGTFCHFSVSFFRRLASLLSVFLVISSLFSYLSLTFDHFWSLLITFDHFSKIFSLFCSLKISKITLRINCSILSSIRVPYFLHVISLTKNWCRSSSVLSSGLQKICVHNLFGLRPDVPSRPSRRSRRP